MGRLRRNGAAPPRRRGGPGGHLDMSMLEAITLMQSSEWLHSQLLRRPPVKRSVEVPSIEPAKDGYVGISMVTGQQWLDFAAMVDCPEFTEIPQLRFQIGRWDYRDWIRERIDPWMRERTVAEIVELGQLFRLPLAPLGNGSTIPDMDHLRSAAYTSAIPWIPATPRTMADVGRWPGACVTPLLGGVSRWCLTLGAKGIGAAHSRRGCRSPVYGSSTSPRSGPGRRGAIAGGVRGRRHQGRVDPASGRHPVLRRNAHRRR